MAKEKSKKFKYQERSKESWKKNQDESSGNYDTYLKDVPKFKVADGKNRIRVLPPTWDDADDFAYTLLVHYGIGAEDQTYLCLAMKDEPCPICEEAIRLQKDGEGEEAKLFKNKKRKLVWLLDRKNEDEGPMVWAMPFGTWKDVQQVCVDEDGEVLQLDHPDEGYDVLFNREGQGQRTKYTGVKLGKSRPILEDEDENTKVKDYIAERPLDSVLQFYDAKYLESVLAGGTPSKDDDEDEDEEEEKSKKASKKKSKSDDDDETPKKDKKRQRSRLKDDEDEDESPKKASKKKADEDEEDEDPDADMEDGDEPDFDEMDADELQEFIDDKELDVELDEDDGIKKQRKQVAKAWTAKQAEGEGDEDEEPKKASKKKSKSEDEEEEGSEDEDEEDTSSSAASKKLKEAAKRAKEKSKKKSKKDEDEEDDD